jgi:hypothetical protein
MKIDLIYNNENEDVEAIKVFLNPENLHDPDLFYCSGILWYYDGVAIYDLEASKTLSGKWIDYLGGMEGNLRIIERTFCGL